MRKIFVAIVFLFIFANTILAAPPSIIIKIATGRESGVYNSKAGPLLQQQMGSLKSELIQTNGSVQNIEMLKNNEVDIIFCQLDALISAANVANDIILIKRMYPEYVHLIVNQGGKSSITKFDLKNSKIAIGPDGGGGWITWKSICLSDKKYADVATIPVGGMRALALLESHEVNAVMLVGGLGLGDVLKANDDGDKFGLAAMDDSDFSKTKYKNEKLYESVDIPKVTYPGLIKGAMTWKITTIKVDAVLATTSKWADDHPNEFDKIFSAATKAIPNIKLALEKKK